MDFNSPFFSYFSFSSEILTVLGFGLSIWIMITSKNLKEKFNALVTFKQFRIEQKSLQNELKAIKNLVIEDDSIAERDMIIEISKTLRKLDHYKSYMTKSDKRATKKILKILNQGITKQNMNELANELGILIGFLEIKREYDTYNL